ncbi:DUF1476 domain-containing protein [Skermanella pratensis]|uniref:DUF1476 domain-containing protein n=1 Tax=Skermanella pratensis TaxID=2233999 RepID=UPI0013019546|nr:DUF1476 domain-containing protein [Skermanella pratensis]
MPASHHKHTVPELDAPCPFDATDGYVTARRNLLLGLWAGRRLSLTGTDLETYARSVVKADRDEPGHEDVLRKVRADLKQAGCPVPEAELTSRLVACHAEASRQCAATD